VVWAHEGRTPTRKKNWFFFHQGKMKLGWATGASLWQRSRGKKNQGASVRVERAIDARVRGQREPRVWVQGAPSVASSVVLEGNRVAFSGAHLRRSCAGTGPMLARPDGSGMREWGHSDAGMETLGCRIPGPSWSSRHGWHLCGSRYGASDATRPGPTTTLSRGGRSRPSRSPVLAPRGPGRGSPLGGRPVHSESTKWP
jgi:hypothetical protein